MYEGKNVPYQYGGCQVDSVQHRCYDDGKFAVEVWTNTSRVLIPNSQNGVRDKELFMLWTRMQIDGVKI